MTSTSYASLCTASLAALLLGAGGCAAPSSHGAAAAGVVGGLMTASQLELLRAPYVAGALVAYAIHDPLAPNWRIEGMRIDDDHMRFELRMKALSTGGDGEARMIFMRSARRATQAGGYDGFDIVTYEEGIDSSGLFASRFASGEIRFRQTAAVAAR